VGDLRFLLSLLLVLTVATSPAAARLDELVRDDVPYGAVAEPVAVASYRVQKGDTLWDLGRRFGVDPVLLAAANGLGPEDWLRPGQELVVPSESAVHVVRPGESLWSVAVRYGVAVEDLAARNAITAPDRLLAGQRLIVPGPVARGRVALQTRLEWPLLGPVTSGFGWREGRRHEGVDLAADYGAPVRAAAAGRVIFAGPRGTYGLAVIVDHGGGVATLYAHNSRLLVREGDAVRAGEPLALVGSTGRATGPHLHFEVRYYGVPVDPLWVLTGGRA